MKLGKPKFRVCPYAPFSSGTNRNVVRRASAIGAMFVGALIGGLLVLHGSVPAALAFALVLLASTGIAVQRVSPGAPAWTQTT